MLSWEEFVLGTEQRTTKRLVVLKDVPIPTNHEEKKEFVSDTGQRERFIFAVTKDVPIMQRKEEYVEGTVQRYKYVH